jgi:hypothetical protein
VNVFESLPGSDAYSPDTLLVDRSDAAKTNLLAWQRGALFGGRPGIFTELNVRKQRKMTKLGLG